MISRMALPKKTIYIAFSTLVSRVFGFGRELLMMRFLGVGVIADAFIAAFTIPNSLRKIFAEGALNAALLPTLVTVKRVKSVHEMCAIVTLVFLIVQAFLLLFCFFTQYYADVVVWVTVPGFNQAQTEYARIFTKTLIFFINFVSAAAIFTVALQVMNHFEVPAQSQTVLNILMIFELLFCMYFRISVTLFSYLILFNGLILVLMHWIAYRAVGLKWVMPSRETFKDFFVVGKKFLPCLITIGSVEISLIIDRQMASFLPVGSVSLLYYAQGILRLPLSVFAIAFPTTFLPYISRVAQYAPRRLSYYLLEISKLVTWATLPVALLMSVFSYKMFYTVMLSENFPIESVVIAAHLLVAFSSGLLFFSFNRIAQNLFYALHDTMTPTLITCMGALCNTIFNYLLMKIWGVLGIVIATSVAAAFQSILLVWALGRYHHVTFLWRAWAISLGRTLVHVFFLSIVLYLIYHVLYTTMLQKAGKWATFFVEGKGLWLWVIPMCALVSALYYITRKKFGIRICFLD